VSDTPRTQCVGTTKAGKRCRLPADGINGLCINHDESRRDELAARMGDLGRAGRTKQIEAAREERAEVRRVALATVADIRKLIERAASVAEDSAVDGDKRANAMCRAAAVALELLKTADLEAEVEALRAAVEEIKSAHERRVH
jgi:hypothetical protein